MSNMNAKQSTCKYESNNNFVVEQLLFLSKNKTTNLLDYRQYLEKRDVWYVMINIHKKTNIVKNI